LSYGPHGGGHGHPDKLTLTLYAQGRQWLPDFGSMPYETHWKSEWTAQTVSHNSVVVDGVSQRPTGERDVQWPSDSAQDRVCGRLARFDPEAKLAAASCDTAYPGLVLERSVRLVGACVVDRSDVYPAGGTAPGPNRCFDYVLHVDGDLADCSAPLAARTGTLGERCGFQYVEQTQAADLTTTAALTFGAGGRRLRVWLVPLPAADAKQGAQLILAQGLTNQPTGRMAMVLVRRQGPAATFVTVFEPLGGSAGLTAVRLADGTAPQPLELVLERGGATERIALGNTATATP
jgi:hypothetical protein